MIIQYLREFGITLCWALVGAISMGISLAILLKIFTFLTPSIDEMEEIKKGNIAVAIMLAAVILAFGVVVAFTIMPNFG